LNSLGQEPIKPYGGFMSFSKEPMSNVVTLKIIVYYQKSTEIPDSMQINIIDGNRGEQELLCNNIVKQTYNFSPYDFLSDGLTLRSKFKNLETRFIGKNGDSSGSGKPQFYLETYLNFNFPMFFISNNSAIFKDYPLVTVEKGKIAIINLFVYEAEDDSIYFGLMSKNTDFPIAPKGVIVNGNTGDFIIDTEKLDTGYYSVAFYVWEVGSGEGKSPNWQVFTIKVEDKRLPYFVHLGNSFRDTLGIPYINASKKDTIIQYQCKYFMPKGWL